MNIFIDTSILYPNPFWIGNFNQRLLQVVRNKRVNLIISEVVLLELRYNFEKKLDTNLIELKKINTSLRNNLRRFSDYILPDKTASLRDFDEFYDNLQRLQNVRILKCNNELLQPVLAKAIKREKPFTEKKTELKDALIWLTYSNFANKHGLKKCFFLTNNVNDFCDQEKLKKGEFELHSELKNDCDRFIIFTNIKNFYQANSSYLDKPQRELEKWIEGIDFNDQYVFSLLWDHEGISISDKANYLSDKIDPRSLSDLINHPIIYILGHDIIYWSG
ncbi:PIN domain-containing protein [Reichenbachiella sp. MALMAid0571]|uniref:PIN domain-containing protein n=1 Tax=Reichenbachiella sp. MALMAid0571 TaxID=3143939 RepID=UPI0032DE5AA8